MDILLILCLSSPFFVLLLYKSRIINFSINDEYGLLIPSFLLLAIPFIATSTLSWLENSTNVSKLQALGSILGPIIIAGTAAYINKSISDRSYRSELENRQRETYKEYRSQLRELLKDLREEVKDLSDEDEIEDLISATRTEIKYLALHVLKQLDSAYNRQIVSNLRGLKLVKEQRFDLNFLFEAEGKLKQDLKGVQLAGAILHRVNLGGANLQQANLEGAYLRYSNLERTSLEGASLHSAFMRGVKLRYSNLTKANLSRAYLRDAIFDSANLDQANLSDAALPGADLGKVKNLDKALVNGASYVKERVSHQTDGPQPTIDLRIGHTIFPEGYTPDPRRWKVY